MRRKFHEALQIGQHLAAGPLRAIARLYLIEKDLRQSRAGPEQRTHLPKSPLGCATDYTLVLWPKLGPFILHGEVEIDTNLTENTILPTAVAR